MQIEGECNYDEHKFKYSSQKIFFMSHCFVNVLLLNVNLFLTAVLNLCTSQLHLSLITKILQNETINVETKKKKMNIYAKGPIKVDQK